MSALGPLWFSSDLLQQSDLAGVVDSVLHDAVEELVEIVRASGDGVGEALGRELLDGFDQRLAGFEDLVVRLLPRRGIGACDAWPVLRRVEFERQRLAVDGMARVLDPGCDVQSQLPDAVAVGNRFRSCLLGGDTVENLADRWAMPGVALEGLVELVSDKFGFSHKSTSYRGPHGSNGLFFISTQR